MTKRVRSARGEVVDFDLLRIKEQMASHPPSTDVRARQDFIDKRLSRRLRNLRTPVNYPKAAPVNVEPEAIISEQPQGKLIDQSSPVQQLDNVDPKITKQKARPKT